METVCLQCGDVGFTNAFVDCVRCLKFSVHRYCLDVIPETFDEYVRWVCDGCEGKQKNESTVFENDTILRGTGVHEVPKNNNGVCGVATEKSNVVIVKIEAQVCEDSLQQLCDESEQPDLIKSAESNENSPTEFRETNGKHEEIKGQEPNSSQQFEEENSDNLMKCASVSDEISLKEMVNEKRSAILRPSVEKDKNRVVKDVMDCALLTKVKKYEKTNSKHEEIKGQEPRSSQQLEEENSDNLMKCASVSDEVSVKEMVNEKRSAILRPSVEKDQNRVVTDVTGCTQHTKVKKSEKRDRSSFSQGPSETETGPGAVEHRIVSCESSRSSKKMRIMPSEANFEEQRHETAVAQILDENKGNLEIQCFGVDIKERGVRPSNDHYENIMVRFREEISGAHHVNNLLIQFPEDSTMAPMLGSSRRPIPIITPVWRGRFNILNKKHDTLDGLMAHVSTNACQKVHAEARQLQPVLHLEILPKFEIWPKSFQTSEPNAEHIGLYFLPSTMSERLFDHLVDKMMQEELGMKAIVQNAELLVFPSNELPLGYWMFQSKYYLWGVFRGKRSSASHSQSGFGALEDKPIISANLLSGDKEERRS